MNKLANYWQVSFKLDFNSSLV